MQPNATFTKTDGNTGVVRPTTDGICAVIAPSASGTANQAGSYADKNNLLSDKGQGALTDFGCYLMNWTQKPIVAITPTCSTAGAFGSVTTTGAGSSVITAGGSAPLDDYNVLVTFTVAGTIGVTGIQYTYSLDGGLTTSAPQALGTASTLSIPNSGVSFALAAGTILLGETVACITTGPQMTNGDLSTALEALRVSQLDWESVLVHGPSTATTVSTLDAWLAGLEATGIFNTGVVNTRFRSAGESEATFIAAMGTAFAAASSTRTVVCADGGDLVSLTPGRGITQPRPMALGLMARGMAQDLAIDAAYVAAGAIPGFALYDAKGVQKYHDESKSPGIDALRLAAFRSFPRRAGVFVNNPNLVSPFGSDFVYWQHARVMNAACAAAWDVLTTQLSLGVTVQKSKLVPNTVNITEADAQHLEALARGVISPRLTGRASGYSFTVSRADDLSSNAGATINVTLAIAALRYIKTFSVKAGFVKAI